MLEQVRVVASGLIIKEPVEVEYGDEGVVFVRHPTLPVYGHGDSQEEALRAFCEAFDFQWRHLVEVPEDTLTDGGKRRRRAMLDAVVPSETSER